MNQSVINDLNLVASIVTTSHGSNLMYADGNLLNLIPDSWIVDYIEQSKVNKDLGILKLLINILETDKTTFRNRLLNNKSRGSIYIVFYYDFSVTRDDHSRKSVRSVIVFTKKSGSLYSDFIKRHGEDSHRLTSNWEEITSNLFDDIKLISLYNLMKDLNCFSIKYLTYSYDGSFDQFYVRDLKAILGTFVLVLKSRPDLASKLLSYLRKNV